MCNRFFESDITTTILLITEQLWNFSWWAICSKSKFPCEWLSAILAYASTYTCAQVRSSRFKIQESINIDVTCEWPFLAKEGVRGSQALILAHFRNAMHGKTKPGGPPCKQPACVQAKYFDKVLRWALFMTQNMIYGLVLAGWAVYNYV